MLEVKVSIPGAAAHADISQFNGQFDNIVGDCHFTINAPVDRPDVWLVLEGTNPEDSSAVVPRDRVVYLAAEPAVPIGYWNESAFRRSYLAQFEHVWTFNDVFHRSVTMAPPFLPWMINANHGPTIFAPHERNVDWFRNLQELPKPKAISVICSNKAFSPEHQLRLSFVSAAKEHFKDKLDWFGNGVAPIQSKWEGLAPYRFTLALENRFWPRVFTEKLVDPFLALTVPIYWGAPDVANYFPPDAIHPINLVDLKSSFAAIEEVLDVEAYERFRLPILSAKEMALGEHNLFVRLASVAKRVAGDGQMSDPERIQILPVEVRNFTSRVRRSLGWRIEHLGQHLGRGI